MIPLTAKLHPVASACNAPVKFSAQGVAGDRRGEVLARISHQFGSCFSCIAGFREILRFAQNDNLKLSVILRGGLCPEESLRRFEEEEIFLADVIAACEKCGLDVARFPKANSSFPGGYFSAPHG